MHAYCKLMNFYDSSFQFSTVTTRFSRPLLALLLSIALLHARQSMILPNPVSATIQFALAGTRVD